jgi:ATP-dependent protease Clp ATPase subunit
LEETKSGDSSKNIRSYLKKPKEIRAFLDQYVIGQDQTKKSNVSCSLQSLQTFDATATR